MADQFTDGVPNAANTIAADLVSMDAMFGYFKAVISNFANWSDTTATGVYPKKVVTAKTGDYSVATTDCCGQIIFTNKAASGQVNFTLPDGSAGYQIHFLVATAQYLKVTAGTGDYFRYLSDQSASAGYIRSATVGTAWTLTYSGDDWVVTSIVGLLNVDE